MNPKNPIARLGLILLLMLPLACHLADAPAGKTTMAIEADTSLLRSDRVVIMLQGTGSADTLFDGKLANLDTLQHLPVRDYDGGLAMITIQAFSGGQMVYQERRDYNGGTQSNVTVQVPIDRLHPSHATSLDIRPDNVRLYAGGGAFAMEVHPPDLWQGKALTWSTGDPSVATVSQSGVLTPVHAGVTYVRASFGDTAYDASSVTVAVDVPVLDFGSDTTVAVGATASFQVKVTQEYGDVAAFAWDLDDDGKYEDSAAGTAGQTLFSTPAKAFPVTGDFQIHVRVRDGEGNVATALKRVKVSASVPAIDSLSATPSSARVKDTVRFSAVASGRGAALKSFAWDFDGDGKDDQSGDLQGNGAKVTGAFAYADTKTYKASLRITDAAGASVTTSIQVTVKPDRPTAHVGPPQSVPAGAQVRLQGSGTDSLGTIVLREWKIGTGGFAAASDSGTVTFTAPTAPGVLTCVFRVTNDKGFTDEDSVLVTVNDTKAPSILSLTPRDTTISIKDSVAFVAQAQATDADLKGYALDPVGDGKAILQGDLTGRSAGIRGGHRYADTGTYTVSLQVKDQAGQTASAQARVVVVLDPPKADAGKDTSVPVNGIVNLHGKASDGMGRVIRMEWKIGSDPFTIVSKGDTSFQAPIYPTALPCVFRVMDDDSLLTTASVNVTVAPSSSADLSGLAISAGSLAPAFASGTTSYTVSVPNSVASLTVTPTVAAEGSTVKVNGKAVASGAASGAITVDVGTTVVSIVVTAPDGTTTKTYSLGVTRGISTNADLASLTLSAGTLSPVFAPATIAYTASVSNATASLTVTPGAAAAGSTIKVNGTVVAAGAASGAINLALGTTVVTVAVTAQDGTTTKTYTITVTRPGNGDATLSKLVVSGTALSPAFASSTASYSATVDNSVTSVTVTPTASASGSAIKVNGSAVASGSASGAINLSVGVTAVTINVTAQDTSSKMTYLIGITRSEPSAGLSSLVPSSGSLSPAFSPTGTNFNDTVPFSVATFSLKPTIVGSGSTIVVNPGSHAVISGQSSPATALSIGENIFSVSVTSQDGSLVWGYYVKVIRQAPPLRLAYFVQDVDSGGAHASSAFVSSGGTVSVTHTGAGLYQVLLPGMDDGTIARGAPHVTPFGIKGGYCKTTGMTVPTSPSGGLSTVVACFNSAGVATDMKFSFALYPPRQGHFAYGEMRIGSSATYSPTLWYNSDGGTNSARQSDRFPTTHGAYNFTMGKLWTTIGGADGIMVTGLGQTNDHCVVGSGGSNVNGDYDAEVYCYPPGFAAGTTYGSFTVSVTGPMSLGDNMRLGYATVFGDGTTTKSFSNGGSASVTHTATGVWTLLYNGLGGPVSRPGNVQVSPFNTASLCSVNGWSGNPNLTTEVRCLDPNGNPVDETFSIWVVN